MRKIILILLFAVFAFVEAVAVPAKRTPITITQPNGKTLTYILKGDEVISWCETLDGYTLLRNAEDVLCYAIIDTEGNLVASNVIACNTEERNVEELLFLQDLEKRLFFGGKQMEEFAKRRQSMFGQTPQTAQ
ncbi:MAG: hypothetical protein U0K83_07795 [Bacteroidales bacterium]|jgi:hypothetical protein|nr:hypothetical protein [Bacteroidales bacterium]MEE1098216.1 hypothetical protein [Bacteroidales bacterium]